MAELHCSVAICEEPAWTIYCSHAFCERCKRIAEEVVARKYEWDAIPDVVAVGVQEINDSGEPGPGADDVFDWHDNAVLRAINREFPRSEDG